MDGVAIAENGKIVTDEMIAEWESALGRDEWPEGWHNVGKVIDGKMPPTLAESVTLSVKIPAAMRSAIDKEAKAEGKSTSAYVRGVLAASLMAAS